MERLVNMSEKVEIQQSKEQATMAKGLAWLTAGNILSRLLGVAYVIPWYIWPSRSKCSF